MMRGSEEGFELTELGLADYEHGLGRFIDDTTLRANIIGRRQGQLFPIPKSRAIAGVIIGIAAQDMNNTVNRFAKEWQDTILERRKVAG